MPVLESTDKLAPKSVLRHRPIGDSKHAIGKDTSTITPIAQRASRPADVDGEIVEWKRKTEHTETQQTRAQAGKRGITPSAQKKLPRTPKTAEARNLALAQAHPLLYLGLGMVIMLLLWIVLSTVFGWFNTMLDDIRYGRPRTFQTDAWVGHNEQTGVPSHFIAINLNRRIEIIEISGGDAAHTHIYTGPQLYGPNDDLAPVTLKFIDVNGDHKPDMLICFQGTRIVFINDQGGFRPLSPSERPQVEQFLQHLGQ